MVTLDGNKPTVVLLCCYVVGTHDGPTATSTGKAGAASCCLQGEEDGAGQSQGGRCYVSSSDKVLSLERPRHNSLRVLNTLHFQLQEK